jgi:uncharacterized membrane protein YphA (DoxX/SURF4 family)
MELVDLSASSFVILSLRFFIGLFFVIGALRKVFHLVEFVRGVEAYQILPKGVLRLLALPIPFVEGGVGLMLLFGNATFLSGFMAFGLIMVFTVAVAINLRRGHLVQCNCYGLASTQTISTGTVVRNFLLMTCCLLLVVLSVVNPETISMKFTTWTVAVLLVLELGFAFITTYLTEWAIDINARVNRLVQ